jgi:hypothetical protein
MIVSSSSLPALICDLTVMTFSMRLFCNQTPGVSVGRNLHLLSVHCTFTTVKPRALAIPGHRLEQHALRSPQRPDRPKMSFPDAVVNGPPGNAK